MSGFSPDWLALREPVDHRSRDARLAGRLAAAFAGRSSLNVVDLGCGTGSNLRGTFALLPDIQHWTLVDYDPRLLSAARDRLAGWAGFHERDGDCLVIKTGGKHLRVGFRQVDLNTDLAAALGTGTDLVTASAFFDLCSADFIGRFVAAVAARKLAFYTVLTFNGQQRWTPSHEADGELLQAFCAHQTTDKGFGAAAGPAAAAALGAAFQAAGYVVGEGDSPWRLGLDDMQLISELSSGFGTAVSETGRVPTDVVTAWMEVVRSSALVGHTDTLALPRG